MANLPTTRDTLLARIDERWDALQSLLGRLTPAQLEQPLGDGWSAKVHAGHVTAWERSLLALLRSGSRPAAMGLSEDDWASHDTDALNRTLAERTAPRPLEEVLAEHRATHAELMAQLRSMSQEDLERPYSDYQPDDLPHNGNPVAGWVHGNTWDHYDEHIGWLEAGLAPS